MESLRVVVVKWVIQYWHENEQFYIEQWLDERTPQQFKSIVKEIKLLERCGNMLRLPHSRALGEGLFELRERTYGYRIYYTFLPNHNIIILQAGSKHSQKNDIKISRERLLKCCSKDEKNETKKI
jgi:putative addiction module killer protein